jgi:hypothetical protein
MNEKTAKAGVTPVRQRTQYTCMSTSMMMCLQALGHDCTEDEVNMVMGARPMKGAAWEQALACAQHFGCRATLTMPSTVQQLKAWTDRGVPVMIAWNPEGRDWSHASVVFDVTPCETHGFMVHVADPNIPDPEETVRVVPKSEFYQKWYEKWPNYLVRRPACAIEREITSDGRQVMASSWRSPIHLPSIDELERDGEKGLGAYHDRRIMEQQRKELEEYIEYNFGMTPMKAVEQWLRDNKFIGSPVEDDMRRQLQQIAKKMRTASPKEARTVRDQYGRSWGPRHGLEGPFLYRSGIVLYYDPREAGGSYWDPTTDMYLPHDEAARITRTAMNIRDRDLLHQHEALWAKVGQETAAKFSSALSSSVANGDPIPGHYSSSVNLNYGPTFSTRYISLSVQFGGSTAPNASMLPIFAVTTFPGMGSVRDYPNLPIADLEQEVRSAITDLAKRYLKPFGEVKVRGGGSNKGSQVSVHISEDEVERLAGRLPELGAFLGRAVTRVLTKFKAEFDSTRADRIVDLEQQVAELEKDRKELYEEAAQLRDSGDEKGALDVESIAYQDGVSIIRLQEQLTGLTGIKYQRPEFPNRGRFATAAEHIANIMVGAKPKSRKDKEKIPEAPKRRNEVVQEMLQRGWGSGSHHNRDRDVQKGRSRKEKHKKDLSREASISRVASSWLEACNDAPAAPLFNYVAGEDK